MTTSNHTMVKQFMNSFRNQTNVKEIYQHTTPYSKFHLKENRKKKKNSTQETRPSNDKKSNQSTQTNYTFYKPFKYLKTPRKLLLHSLRLQLNYLFKKKKEQNFILSRLKIVDEQFCVDQIHYLY